MQENLFDTTFQMEFDGKGDISQLFGLKTVAFTVKREKRKSYQVLRNQYAHVGIRVFRVSL